MGNPAGAEHSRYGFIQQEGVGRRYSSAMANCLNCGASFSTVATRDAYNEVLDGEGDYDADHGGGLCFDCAIPAEAASNMDLGRAIMMMNGDEDYDADHVEKYL
jgi:hypothetical protein